MGKNFDQAKPDNIFWCQVENSRLGYYCKNQLFQKGHWKFLEFATKQDVIMFATLLYPMFYIYKKQATSKFLNFFNWTP